MPPPPPKPRAAWELPPPSRRVTAPPPETTEEIIARIQLQTLMEEQKRAKLREETAREIAETSKRVEEAVAQRQEEAKAQIATLKACISRARACRPITYRNAFTGLFTFELETHFANKEVQLIHDRQMWYYRVPVATDQGGFRSQRVQLIIKLDRVETVNVY